MQPRAQKVDNNRTEPPSELDTSNIIKAFEIISSGAQDHDLISQADSYLSNCELNINFPLALIEIFGTISDSRLQWQILVHLKTLFRRNWSSKRRYYEGVRLSEEVKNEVKSKLILLYQNFWKTFHRQFNDIFKVVAK